MKLVISVARPNLVSPGTCSGRFSKSRKFKLHVTSLDYLAQYAKYKGKHNLQMDCEMYHREKNYLLRFG